MVEEQRPKKREKNGQERGDIHAQFGAARDEIRAQFEATKAHIDATSAKIEAKAGRNLFWAVGSGLLFGAVFLFSLFALPGLFVILVGAIVGVTVLEFTTAVRTVGRYVPRLGAVLASLGVVASTYYLGAVGLLVSLLFSVVVVTVWRSIELWILPSHRSSTIKFGTDLAAGVLVLVYVAFFASFTILLRQGTSGEWWIFTFVAVVVSIDTGAYIAGITLGKHKMTPRISPNKTWEGFVGAALAGQLAAILLTVFALGYPWWAGSILGFVLLLTATGGDLTESLIKRDLGIKDMSSWIPGHGGFLDRLDSLLPSAAATYGVYLVFALT
ncbi:phosphatidate cytidylyltransferase [Lysinibacter sp. HNR]|uniref:phosphatidate cytidylyltransferase n=1 Tax=Lysinibacter sp. HNR TaxID=3031408 RepID=UPI0024349202|nr:phosphatidate cytidylyltransferase [Lysinibacter sp. HNR]WGD38428.1 phosphatidate cytidylyltransferase [Lysinibacter sp. HNR]